MRTCWSWSLGQFGDARLDKGGLRFSGVCFANAVCLYAGLLEAPGGGKCVSGGSWPMPG
jgi:hypothetical protein